MVTVVFYDSDDDMFIKGFSTLEDADTFVSEHYFDDRNENIFNARILVDAEICETYKKLYEEMKEEFFSREIRRNLSVS
jgi:hypothetical protein